MYLVTTQETLHRDTPEKGMIADTELIADRAEIRDTIINLIDADFEADTVVYAEDEHTGADIELTVGDYFSAKEINLVDQAIEYYCMISPADILQADYIKDTLERYTTGRSQCITS